MLKSDLKCLEVQKIVFEKMYHGMEVNSFAPRKEQGENIRDDGIVYVNDICYGDVYPNPYGDLLFFTFMAAVLFLVIR